MKRLSWAFAILLFAAPAFAQDEGGGGGGGLASSLFDSSNFGGRSDQPKPIEAVKKFFAQANVTFSGDQEKAIKPIVDDAFKQVQDTVERLGGQPGAGERPEARGQAGERRGGFAGGNRGGFRGGRGGNNNPELTAALQKINDDVLTKVVATLKPDQQTAFKKWQNAQIKNAGGYPALKVVMEEAGAPLTPEQEPQIQALFDEQRQQRIQLQRESQGTADPAKVADLEKTTMAKVVKLLTPAQRQALLNSRPK